MLRLGPGAAAVEVELPAAPKTGALGRELPVVGALGDESKGAFESELAGALGSVSVPVGALESKFAGSCVFPGSVSPVVSRQFAGGLSF